MAKMAKMAKMARGDLMKAASKADRVGGGTFGLGRRKMVNTQWGRLFGALIVGTLCLAVVTGCDQTVRIALLTKDLQKIYVAGGGYTPLSDGAGGGLTCDINQDSFDLKVLLLGNTKERDLEILRDGDLLENCVFELGESVNDSNICRFNPESIERRKATVERLSTLCVRDDECDEGWTCNLLDGFCEAHIDLQVRDVAFERYPDVEEDEVKGRLIAIIVDNSGSIQGRHGEGTPPGNFTDPNDVRLAAATTLVDSLDPGRDRVGIYAMSGTGGTDGVRFVSKDKGGEAQGGGFYRTVRGHEIVKQAIDELGRNEQGGTPIWDGIAIAADDMRAVADLNDYRPSIIVFTDGYWNQEDPQTTRDDVYGPVTSFSDAVSAVASETQPIPVFIVHLENVLALTKVLGRDPRLAELACVSGGAYYRVTDPNAVKTPFENLFKHVTLGYYRLRIGYIQLRVEEKFPAGEDYAITANFAVSIGGRTESFALARGNIRGDPYDSRVFVTKPAE